MSEGEDARSVGRGSAQRGAARVLGVLRLAGLHLTRGPARQVTVPPSGGTF